MSIASRITEIENHVGDIYDTLEIAGSDLTNVDKNIVNINVELIDRLIYYINNGIGTVIENWPKVTGSGTSITLNDTITAPLQDLKLKPSELYQNGTPSPAESETVHTISGNNTITISDGTDATNYSITLGDVEYCKITDDYADEFGKSSGRNVFDKSSSPVFLRNVTITELNTGIRVTTSGSTYDYCFGVFLLGKADEFNGKKIRVSSNIIKQTDDGIIRLISCQQDGSSRTQLDGISGSGVTTLEYQVSNVSSDLYIGLQLYANSTTTGNLHTDYTNLIITVDNSDLTYEPYGTSWYLKKNIDKVVFNGTETWYKETVANNTNFRTALGTALGGDTTISCKSNYFIGVTGNQSYQGNIDNAIGIGGSKNLRIRSSYFETYDTTAFKTWLTSNNTTVYYQLATPTYTVLSSTLQTELDNLYNAKSKDNQTVITQTNNDLPFIIDVKALTKLGDDE